MTTEREAAARGPAEQIADEMGLAQRRGAVALHFMWTIEFRTQGHREEDLPRLEALIRREQLQAMRRIVGYLGPDRARDLELTDESIRRLLDEDPGAGEDGG